MEVGEVGTGPVEDTEFPRRAVRPSDRPEGLKGLDRGSLGWKRDCDGQGDRGNDPRGVLDKTAEDRGREVPWGSVPASPTTPSNEVQGVLVSTVDTGPGRPSGRQEKRLWLLKRLTLRLLN